MSVVEIRCPRCGAVCSKASAKYGEYVCAHCNTTFRFVDPSQRVITKELRVRNCIHCGRPIESGYGFKCTKCGQEYFCSFCVDEVEHRFVCTECLTEMGAKCPHCNKYAVYRCVACDRKACKKHVVESQFTYSPTEGLVRYCEKCRSFVCMKCTKTSLFGGMRCPKCNSSLTIYSPYK